MLFENLLSLEVVQTLEVTIDIETIMSAHTVSAQSAAKIREGN